jgi:hypothetical protein
MRWSFADATIFLLWMQAATQIISFRILEMPFAESASTPELLLKSVTSLTIRENRVDSGAYCAIGNILYTSIDGAPNEVLLYIKPALRGGEPTDIFNYAQANLQFPHESTGDQFFSNNNSRVIGCWVNMRLNKYLRRTG